MIFKGSLFLYLESAFIRSIEHNIRNNQLSFVESISEFMINFDNRFKSSLWIKAINFNTFHISGGSIVNSLCTQPFFDTSTEEVDINFNGDSFNEFDDAVVDTFSRLTTIFSKIDYDLQPTLVKNSNLVYIIILPLDIKLRFNFKNVLNEVDPVCYVLYSSDLDISQVAFTGQIN